MTVQIPNSPFIALAADTNLTPLALEKGTIKIEQSIAECSIVQQLKPGDVVLDVGAFIGDTALIFQDKGALVVAFEPQDDAFHCLCHNSPKSINVRAAIGDGSFVECLPFGVGGNLGARRVIRSEAGTASVRIDDWLADNPQLWDKLKLIKIDVEGFEPAVIDGAVKTIHLFQPNLLIEVYPELLAAQHYKPEDIYSKLNGLGYRWETIIGRTSEPRWDIAAYPI